MEQKIKKFRWDGGTVRTIELILDLLVIILGFNIAWYLRDYLFSDGDLFRTLKEIFVWFFTDVIPNEPGKILNDFYAFINVVGNSILYIFVFIIMFRIFECTVQKKAYLNLMKSIFLALVFTNLVMVLVNVVFKEFGIYIKVDTYIYAFLGQFGILAVLKFFEVRFMRKRLFKKTIVIGPKEEADYLVTKICLDKNTRAKIEYIIYTDTLRSFTTVFPLIDCTDVVYVTEGVATNSKNDVIEYCLGQRKKDVILEPKMYELTIFNTEPSTIDDKLIFNLPSLEVSLEQRFLKRLFDIVVAIVGIILSLPLMIIIGLLIKIEDRGPIFYKQDRVTKGGKVFKIIKLRSMRTDSETKTGAILATKNDTRITKVGKFIRATRLDEIPQFFNVLGGSMSIVGPRPERPELIAKIKEQYDEFEYRINVKAGITGYAHVFGKYSTKPADRLRMDLLYIRKQNIFFDIKILFYTILTVLTSSSSEGLSEHPTVDEVLAKRQMMTNRVNENIYFVTRRLGR